MQLVTGSASDSRVTTHDIGDVHGKAKVMGRPKVKVRSKLAARSGEPIHVLTGPTKPELRIGTRLKHGRLTKGLSLKQVAEAAGCSESFVSKIEHDRVRPSLAMLHRLVKALEVNVASLFNEEDGKDIDPVLVLGPENRPIIKMDPLRQGDGITLERLIPNARSSLLQANIHHVYPGGTSDGQIQHEGEEIGYVIEGELELTVETRVYHLHNGESFFFASHLPHGYRNPGKSVTRVLWINSPPSF